MIIQKKTIEDLSKEEIDIFINNYSFRTTNELVYLMKLDKDEIKKLKKEVEEERGITLTKNSQYISKDRNPDKGGITLLTKVLNGMEEKDRREIIEFTRNLPDNVTLMKQLIGIQTVRLNLGVSAELASPGMGLDKQTEEAVGNYFQMVKATEEMENGIQMNHNIEHSFAQLIKEATERNKDSSEVVDDIIIEAPSEIKKERKEEYHKYYNPDPEEVVEEEIDLDTKEDNLESDEEERDNVLLSYLKKGEDDD